MSVAKVSTGVTKYTLEELAGAWKGELEIPYEGDHDPREWLDDLPS